LPELRKQELKAGATYAEVSLRLEGEERRNYQQGRKGCQANEKPTLQPPAASEELSGNGEFVVSLGFVGRLIAARGRERGPLP